MYSPAAPNAARASRWKSSQAVRLRYTGHCRVRRAFKFSKKLAEGEVSVPAPETSERPMTMVEKIIARKLAAPGKNHYVKAHDAVLAKTDGGYSHEFTSAQVHEFLRREFGSDYTVKNPVKLAVFEDHLLYADGVARFARFKDKIQTLRDLQREFQAHTGVRDYSAKNGNTRYLPSGGKRTLHRSR